MTVVVGLGVWCGMAGSLCSPHRTESPWAVATADSADASLEATLGAYPLDPGCTGDPGWDQEDMSDMAGDVR